MADVTTHHNLFDESRVEYYNYNTDNLDGAFDVFFDWKLFDAPAKIKKL